MKRSLHRALLPGLSSLFALPALGQSSCDCTAIVDSCSAEVAVRDSWIEVTSDHAQCSRVDYFVDGLPFVAVVVDGTQRQDRLGANASPEILVQSCQVCRTQSQAASAAPASPAPDREQASAADRSADAAGGDGSLVPLIEVAPQYPQSARERGIEGHVELSFTVDPDGTVESPTVTAAQPPGVFDQAALAAVRRWRYAADPQRSPQTVEDRVEFMLERPTEGRADAGRTAPAGPRNECIREDAVYNYGDAVDVDLINACAEPLLVYACATGTSRYAGRWVCTSADESRELLVPPGDSRIGGIASVETRQGTRNFEYIAEVLVARAPNTQYWWAACRREDLQCRENARQWVRSLDRQTAEIDPQARSTIAIARSY